MKKLAEDLRAVVGRDGVLTEPDELIVYECDGLPQHKHRPRAVVFPRSTKQVAEVVRITTQAGVAFAPRGAGTGLSGGALALDNSVIIELARMRRVLELDIENRIARVETGIVNSHLSRLAAPHGLHYAPDPSSQATCTIGGNIAENAGGIHCLKYGMTVDHVLAARVVLTNGEIVELGGLSADASRGNLLGDGLSNDLPGYDLLGVFVGSEGTFGIATEATLRLTPLPAAVRTLLADFTDINQASHAVSAIIARGLVPAALEMVDGRTIRAVEASVFAAGLPVDAEAALLIELDGLEAGLDREAEEAESICRAYGARDVRRARDDYERKKLWAARKGAFGAMGRISPDLMLQDAVVPRSRLPEVLAATYQIGLKYNLRVANVFHAGDGNLHPFICFDSRIADEVKRVKEAGRELIEMCVGAGGTITGEHGVGTDKSEYLPLIFSEIDMDVMLKVRHAFDPTGLCNPGKIIPTRRSCGEARGTNRPIAKVEASVPPAVAGGSPGAYNPLATAGGTDNSDSRRATAEILQQTSAREQASLDASGKRANGLFNVDSAFSALAQVVGGEHVVSSKDCWTATHDSSNSLTVAPASIEEACEVLRLASSERWRVVPAGAGMWLDAVNDLSGVNLVIETRRLSRIVEHEPADLVATAEAGVTLADFNRELARHGQWLPLDPPDDADSGRATLGGIAATGLGGASSFGYGLPRSSVIGMRVVLADGRRVRAGGRVVKNVAGYDLCKLFVGSYGTLGLITELTFKLRPRPQSEATLAIHEADLPSLLDGSRNLLRAQLLPVALELLSPALAAHVNVSTSANKLTTLVHFAGTDEAVADQLVRARQLLTNGQVAASSIETISEDAPVWRNLAACSLKRTAAATAQRLVWRANVRPTALRGLLEAIEESVREVNGQVMWHAGVGSGSVRVIEESQSADVTKLKARLENLNGAANNSMVIEESPLELRRTVPERRSASSGSTNLGRRIKAQLDPQNLWPSYHS